MSSKTTNIKLQLLWEHGKRCAICGKKISSYDELTVDHIIPRSKGGKNVLSNCQLAHRACNSKKNDTMPDKFEQLLRYNKRRIIFMRIKKAIIVW